MKIKTGIDIIEIDRIKKNIDNTNDKFCDKVFTKLEIDYCESKKRQRYQHYAARFAAKEATFKALSDKLDNKFQISWKDIEILNKNDGKPYIIIPNEYMKDIEDIDLSISHCQSYAIANVVILFK